MSITVEENSRYKGVYQVVLEDGSTRVATLNLTPGRDVYGERLVSVDGREYRLWDPYKSKLAAAVLRRIPDLPIQQGHKVLYLGAASGTTVSHVSDIVGAEGCVYSVEFSYRSIRELVTNVAAYRMRVFPILADARFPDSYRMLLEQVDVVYCDVAQPEQARILADNSATFLKMGSCHACHQSKEYRCNKAALRVFRDEVDVLRARGFKIKNTTPLKPFDRAHTMVTAEYTG